MNTISHRDMRNNSAEVLRRVQAGESLEVTNNGQPAAILSPIDQDPIKDAIARGQGTPARAGLEVLRKIKRTSGGPKTTAEILADVRGRG